MCRNNKGYEIAEHLSAKFTHVSPVWLQLRWDAAAAAFLVAGQHDIDAGWMARVAQPKARLCMYKPYTVDAAVCASICVLLVCKACNHYAEIMMHRVYHPCHEALSRSKIEVPAHT